jgi:hypothetical protein
MGKNKGFRLFEVKDSIQIENLKYYYYGIIDWTFKPIIKANESVKANMESKKQLLLLLFIFIIFPFSLHDEVIDWFTRLVESAYTHE